MSRPCLAILTLFLCLFNCVHADEPTKEGDKSVSSPDREKNDDLSFSDLKGAWTPFKALEGGATKPRKFKQVIWNFTDPHTLVIHGTPKDKRKKPANQRFVLNLDFTQTPATFRFSPVGADIAIHGIVKKSETGITIALSHPAETDKPPAEFVSKEGTRTTLMEFKRPVIPPAN